MAKKRIGILFGMEDTFPWSLVNEVNVRAAAAGEEIEAVPVQVGHVRQDEGLGYDVILDRISHEVPFYRTILKLAAARGAQVVNDPFWWSADDKFLDNAVALAAGVAVPKTVLLPHKEHPANTTDRSFRNLKYVDWGEVFSYLGWPVFMKPAYGGGWRDVYRCEDEKEFFAAYDQTRDLTMMAQEAIEFTDYFRCYVVGRRDVHVMQYAPKEPHAMRYSAVAGKPVHPELEARVVRDSLALCEALGYDLNTVEFAVRDGIPYAIDFMNPAPDAERTSVGEENFQWIVGAVASMLMDRARSPRAFRPFGTWPRLLGLEDPSQGRPTRAERTTEKREARPADAAGAGSPRPGKTVAKAAPKPAPKPAAAPVPAKGGAKRPKKG